jgi:hypothetical protein
VYTLLKISSTEINKKNLWTDLIPFQVLCHKWEKNLDENSQFNFKVQKPPSKCIYLVFAYKILSIIASAPSIKKSKSINEPLGIRYFS